MDYMTELLDYSKNGLFPMVVSFYLLFRVEGKLDQLTQAITALKEVVKQ